MTFYGTTATAAGIVVPKKYLQQVGEDGFKKHPIGPGRISLSATPQALNSSSMPTPAIGAKYQMCNA